MLTYSFKRLAQLFVTILGVVTLVFFTMRLIPGILFRPWPATICRAPRSTRCGNRWG